jgi:hypothetical protein
MSSTNENENYYIEKKDEYWKQLKMLIRSSEKILPKYLDLQVSDIVQNEAKEEFEFFLTQLPYIGGDQNIFTFTFVSSAAALAYIRVLEKYGLSVSTIGKVLNEIFGDVYENLPGVVKWYLRWSEFSPGRRKKLEAFARESQKKEYPDNWVMEYVEGEGKEFDYACNFSECAVLKFFTKMEADEYMPYVCVMDFTSSKALRTGLHRTATVYYGGDYCDFQFKKNRPSLPGIPIEDLLEYKNRK